MATVAIPAWTANGVLPPINVFDPMSAERSPYTVSLLEFVLRFGTSPKRRKILDGYLQYRRRLHAAGLKAGFQWLDGSFMENVETTETRDPNDLDVVTFFSLSVGITQQQVFAHSPDLFPRTAADHNRIKATFFVDGYFVSLGSRAGFLVERSAYWYGAWSHRRNGTWKGFLQVDLDPIDDTLATLNLQAGGTV